MTFTKKTKKLLQGIDVDDDGVIPATRAKWLREAAGLHAKLGNKLISIARRMKVAVDEEGR